MFIRFIALSMIMFSTCVYAQANCAELFQVIGRELKLAQSLKHKFRKFLRPGIFEREKLSLLEQIDYWKRRGGRQNSIFNMNIEYYRSVARNAMVFDGNVHSIVEQIRPLMFTVLANYHTVRYNDEILLALKNLLQSEVGRERGIIAEILANSGIEAVDLRAIRAAKDRFELRDELMILRNSLLAQMRTSDVLNSSLENSLAMVEGATERLHLNLGSYSHTRVRRNIRDVLQRFSMTESRLNAALLASDHEVMMRQVSDFIVRLENENIRLTTAIHLEKRNYIAVYNTIQNYLQSEDANVRWRAQYVLTQFQGNHLLQNFIFLTGRELETPTAAQIHALTDRFPISEYRALRFSLNQERVLTLLTQYPRMFLQVIDQIMDVMVSRLGTISPELVTTLRRAELRRWFIGLEDLGNQLTHYINIEPFLCSRADMNIQLQQLNNVYAASTSSFLETFARRSDAGGKWNDLLAAANSNQNFSRLAQAMNEAQERALTLPHLPPWQVPDAAMINGVIMRSLVATVSTATAIFGTSYAVLNSDAVSSLTTDTISSEDGEHAESMSDIESEAIEEVVGDQQ